MNDIKYYDLVKSQTGIKWILLLSRHSQTASVPLYMVVDRVLDMSLLCRAAELEAARNDSMRLRFKKSLFNIKQYFVPHMTIADKIVTVDFTGKTEAEELEFLRRDAARPLDYKHGEVVRLIFYRTHDGKTGIYCNFFHMNSDAMGAVAMFCDLLSVYSALAAGTEMPPPLASFEEKIINEHELYKSKTYEHELEAARAAMKSFGTPFLAAPWGMDKLKAIRAKKHDESIYTYNTFNPFNDISENAVLNIGRELTKRLTEFCAEHSVSVQAVLHMGYRTYCSYKNERSATVCIDTVCDRRKTKSDKRMGGCIMSDFEYWLTLSEEESFTGAVTSINNIIKNTYRFSDVFSSEQTNIRKEFFSSSALSASMMMTYMPLSGVTAQGWKYRCGGVSTGYFTLPLYVFAIHNADEGDITSVYEYKTEYLTRENIIEMHDAAVRVIAAGLEKPDITVGELIDIAGAK